MKIVINLDKYHNETSIVKNLSPLNYIGKRDVVEISFILTKERFIDNAALLLVVTVYKELQENEYNNIRVSFPSNLNIDCIRYLSRINFLSLLDIPYYEDFNRHNSKGRFLEMSRIAAGSMTLGMTENVITIIEKTFQLDQKSINSIIYVINELICNITIHAKSLHGGYIYCQKYPKRGVLELIIADAGIGIHKSLKIKYPNYNNQQALRACIDKGITNGNGHGIGLYSIYDMIKKNEGEMMLISGENTLHLKRSRTFIRNNKYWKGVILKCKFNLKNNITDEYGAFSESW